MTENMIRPAANEADHAITATTPSNGSRFCTECGHLRCLEEMAPDRRAKDGRRSVCKTCRRKYDRARYVANRGVWWRNEYLRRAKGFGVEPVADLLTPEAIVAHWGDCCFYCEDGGFEQIDHFIAVAAGGHHVLDNVVPCCRTCNTKKRWEIDEQAIRLLRKAQAEEGRNAASDALRPT